MKLDDPSLDSTVSQVRDAWLVDAVREQIAFVRAKVPFWRERLSNAAVDERCIESLADFARVPIYTKEELRATRPAALLPNDTRLELKISRWTSGTSGQPTVNFWSETDWAALVASTARMLGRQAPKQAPTAFNAYSQAHVTGPLYNGALRRLGAVVYDRSHHPEELFSTLAQTELFDFDTLIVPERTTRGKGLDSSIYWTKIRSFWHAVGCFGGSAQAGHLALRLWNGFGRRGFRSSATFTAPRSLPCLPYPVRKSLGTTMSPKVTFWSRSSTRSASRWKTVSSVGLSLRICAEWTGTVRRAPMGVPRSFGWQQEIARRSSAMLAVAGSPHRASAESSASERRESVTRKLADNFSVARHPPRHPALIAYCVSLNRVVPVLFQGRQAWQ
jgi:hypothetical protein